MSGNVFRDFGYPDADVRQAKALLAAQIIKVLDAEALSTRRGQNLGCLTACSRPGSSPSCVTGFWPARRRAARGASPGRNNGAAHRARGAASRALQDI